MESGIVRRIDELGRIVIPKELRRTMRLSVGDEMEIFAVDGNLILKKYSAYKSVKNSVSAVLKSLAESVEADVILVDSASIILAEGAKKKE